VIWLVLAGFVNLLMLPTVRSINPILNLDISMPLMVAFSSYYLFDIKREKLAYYMLPVCAASAYLAVTSVLSGLGGFVIDEYYEASVAKNQVGAAFTSMAIICLVFLLELQKPLFKIGYGALSIICLYPAVFFACRTALLSYIIVAAILLYRDYKFKGLIILGLLIGAYVLYAPDSLEAILYDSVVGHRDADNLDDISSGRISQAAESLAYFLHHPLFGFYGSGDSYNLMPRNAHIFILYRLTKWGIIGAIPFLALYFSILKILVSSFRAKDLLLAGTLLVAYISSFAEYAPPFGPGSCFIITFIFVGYYLRNNGRGHVNLDKR
jgi:O-antigen ligase